MQLDQEIKENVTTTDASAAQCKLKVHSYTNQYIETLLNHAPIDQVYKVCLARPSDKLPLRLSKHQSMSSQTVLLRTTLTRAIILQ